MVLTKLCSVTDIPVGEARRFPVADGWVAVVNMGDGEFRAVDAICSHEHYYLDDGEVDVEERSIECAKHGSTFDLDTGKPRSLPAVMPVAVYDLKIENDDILIEV